MSSNKTDAGNFMYNRKSAKSCFNPGGQETVIPGFSSSPSENFPPESCGRVVSNEPVVGFLYSISRNGFGEFWPLYIGKNQIGRDDDNSVCLKEKTVSGRHATLFIRRRQSEGHELIAQIQDVGSRNGIFVNDEDPGFNAMPCSNGDIIRIGNCYTLLLILINPEQAGLSVAKDFIPADDGQEADSNTDYEMDRNSHFSSGATEAIDGVSDNIPGLTK